MGTRSADAPKGWRRSFGKWFRVLGRGGNRVSIRVWSGPGSGAEIVIDARRNGDVGAALKEAGEMVAWLRGG